MYCSVVAGGGRACVVTNRGEGEDQMMMMMTGIREFIMPPSGAVCPSLGILHQLCVTMERDTHLILQAGQVRWECHHHHHWPHILSITTSIIIDTTGAIKVEMGILLVLMGLPGINIISKQQPQLHWPPLVGARETHWIDNIQTRHVKNPLSINDINKADPQTHVGQAEC